MGFDWTEACLVGVWSQNWVQSYKSENQGEPKVTKNESIKRGKIMSFVCWTQQ